MSVALPAGKGTVKRKPRRVASPIRKESERKQRNTERNNPVCVARPAGEVTGKSKLRREARPRIKETKRGTTGRALHVAEQT